MSKQPNLIQSSHSLQIGADRASILGEPDHVSLVPSTGIGLARMRAAPGVAPDEVVVVSQLSGGGSVRVLTYDQGLDPVVITGPQGTYTTIPITPIVLDDTNFPVGSVLNITGNLSLESFGIVNTNVFGQVWTFNGTPSVFSDGLIYVVSDEILPPVNFSLTVVRFQTEIIAMQGGFYKNGTIFGGVALSQNAVVLPTLYTDPLPLTIGLASDTTTPADSPQIILNTLLSTITPVVLP